MAELSDKISVMKMIATNENGSGMKKVLQDIYNMIDENEDLIKQSYALDKQHTGKKDDIKIKLILDSIEQVINYEFKLDDVFENIDSKRVLGIKQNLGVIGVFYDGDILVTIDLICKALKTNNSIIFNIDVSKNPGTNALIVNNIKDILRKNNKPENLININLSDNDNLLLEDLDVVVVIGSREKRIGFKQVTSHPVIESGYGYNEIYIENDTYKEFILKILSEDVNIKFYVKEGIDLGIEAIEVRDIDEAISIINRNGANYSVAIFTDDENNAKNFITKVHSKYAFVNASSTLASDLDIGLENLYYNKICVV